MKIIRFRTKDGMFRVAAESSWTLHQVFDDLSSKIPQFPRYDRVYLGKTPQDVTESAAPYLESTIEELNFANGQLLYLKWDTIGGPSSSTQDSVPTSNPISIDSLGIKKLVSAPKAVSQLPVDDFLDSQEGTIPRKRGQFCHHSDRGMCEYCSPLPPWDNKYKEEHGIKHISFHAYVKEMNESKNKKNSVGSYISPLVEQNYKITSHCPSGHAPWPKGICSKCQPSAITLQQQKFRLVDHVEFSSSGIINDFINCWRLNGCQRIGLLMGTYEVYDKVPLGVKAKVEAIYEMPQLDLEDGLTYTELNEENEAALKELAENLGLQPVGVIFTDLTDAGLGDGSVICKRHKDSFFLSSLEIKFAARLQLKYPNICKWSDSGKFSSKFVTCVVSGNTKGDIDISSYQVSQSGEALVEADLICASTHPDMAIVNKTNEVRYVPDIFFQKINQYGIQVKVNAKPHFPAEYLLVSLTHGFPTGESQSVSLFSDTSSFPIENREHVGESQDWKAIKKSVDFSTHDLHNLRQSLANFHLLLYLSTTGILSKEELQLLFQTVRGKEETRETSFYKLLESSGFKTLTTIIQTS
ncbi:BA75_04325T0 [Komagataella pastoris]|uniref:Nuclear protein localization protein 4 n=1 Tax=Komagataella pastoris TaxID=4922 RepID=A0A1B2JFG5_PICPA|nr:BA75_04325T0 [Komagataella pastoris]